MAHVAHDAMESSQFNSSLIPHANATVIAIAIVQTISSGMCHYRFHSSHYHSSSSPLAHYSQTPLPFHGAVSAAFSFAFSLLLFFFLAVKQCIVIIVYLCGFSYHAHNFHVIHKIAWPDSNFISTNTPKVQPIFNASPVPSSIYSYSDRMSWQTEFLIWHDYSKWSGGNQHFTFDISHQYTYSLIKTSYSVSSAPTVITLIIVFKWFCWCWKIGNQFECSSLYEIAILNGNVLCISVYAMQTLNEKLVVTDYGWCL